MTFRQTKKPGSRPAERTEAQWKALRIFQLRGLYHNLHVLSKERRWGVQRVIDDQIAELGGERESRRWERRVRAWTEDPSNADATINFDEVIF